MINSWGIGNDQPEKYIVDDFLEKMRTFQSELTTAEGAYPQLASDFQALYGQVESLIREIQNNRETSVGEFDEYMYEKREY